MSKSASTYMIPAVGGAAAVLGLAFALASRDYGSSKIDTLESRGAEVEAQAEAASGTAQAEAAKAAELEAAIAEIQEQAALRVAAGPVSEPAPVRDGTYGLGRAAHAEEIAAWDVDILPDGRGLPEGRGDVFTGEEVFADYCASCHGDFAEGVDNWPVLAGGFDTLADKDPVKTVGSYWPYLSTVWDYVHRSMPFGGAQTLTDDEVYAIVAYILYSNDLVDDDFELSHENFAEFAMYNAEGFIVDDRAETEYPIWSGEPCMENCKPQVEITMRASVLNVTPEEEGGEEHGAMAAPAAEDTVQFVAASTQDVEEAAPAAGADPELVAKGEKVFKKCAACHAVGAGAKNKSGPQLNGVMGRTLGTVEGFGYSSVFVAAADEGRVWTDEDMRAFLTKTKAFMKGTKMGFAGLKKEADLDAILAYLQTFDG